MQDTHAYLICGLCGILFFLIASYRSLKIDAAKANTYISFKSYLAKDWPGHVLAILPVIMWYYTFGEAAKKYPALQDYARISFALWGAMGSWGFQKILSKSKAWIRGVVDEKTDIADNK